MRKRETDRERKIEKGRDRERESKVIQTGKERKNRQIEIDEYERKKKNYQFETEHLPMLETNCRNILVFQIPKHVP